MINVHRVRFWTAQKLAEKLGCLECVRNIIRLMSTSMEYFMWWPSGAEGDGIGFDRGIVMYPIAKAYQQNDCS